ncbi:hypothetical protein NK718_10860 [Alsobacter sp. SYSU M60028]|uniref:DUF494 family protein n=1 Tax=Alsobacter ponti TaxID=2962936 RepID=A0ABT1LBZ4_9HYPH|nr:hypothetical protein [Alsobacter ponti]MCP8939017.1 hypothetical protein [Alsobacter ponti]
MFRSRIQNIVIRLIEKQNATADDVRDLRNALEEGGFITQDEAEALIRVERMVPSTCEAWGEFFVETLTAHLVWERRPTGVLRADDVAWLIHQLEQPREAAAGNVAPLLVSLVREAEHVDERLLALALAANGAGSAAPGAASLAARAA